eukprot:g23665.t1
MSSAERLEASAAEAAKQEVGGRSRKQRAHEHAPTAEVPGDFLYVCCDRCSKWRRLPDHYRLDQLPKKWFCEMNPDVSRARCAVPEESALSPIVRFADQFCTLCLLPASHEPGMVLLHCRGPCLRSFHHNCAELLDLGASQANDKAATADRSTPTDWYCQDCLLDTHCCFQCLVRGRHGIDLFQCPAICGNFFHPHCIDPDPSGLTASPALSRQLPIRHKPRPAPRGNELLALRRYTTASGLVLCPHHACATCGKSLRSLRQVSCARCAKCPAAYHLTPKCRPAGVVLLSVDAVLCPAHAERLAPSPGRGERLSPSPPPQTTYRSPKSARHLASSSPHSPSSPFLSAPSPTSPPRAFLPSPGAPPLSANSLATNKYRLFRLTSEAAGRFPALVSMLASASVPSRQLLAAHTSPCLAPPAPPGLPVRLQHLTVLCLGRVLLKSEFQRAASTSPHLPALTYPVGFKSTLQLPSILETGQQTHYVTDIIEKKQGKKEGGAARQGQNGSGAGQASRPWFRVTATDSGEVFEAGSASAVWKQVKSKIVAALGKRAGNWATKLPQVGEIAMGLTEPTVQSMIARLPNACFCPAYAHLPHTDGLEEDEAESEAEEEAKEDTVFEEKAFEEIARRAALINSPTQSSSDEHEEEESESHQGEEQGAFSRHSSPEHTYDATRAGKCSRKRKARRSPPHADAATGDKADEQLAEPAGGGAESESGREASGREEEAAEEAEEEVSSSLLQVVQDAVAAQDEADAAPNALAALAAQATPAAESEQEDEDKAKDKDKESEEGAEAAAAEDAPATSPPAAAPAALSGRKRKAGEGSSKTARGKRGRRRRGR